MILNLDEKERFERQSCMIFGTIQSDQGRHLGLNCKDKTRHRCATLVCLQARCSLRTKIEINLDTPLYYYLSKSGTPILAAGLENAHTRLLKLVVRNQTHPDIPSSTPKAEHQRWRVVKQIMFMNVNTPTPPSRTPPACFSFSPNATTGIERNARFPSKRGAWSWLLGPKLRPHSPSPILTTTKPLR